MTSSKKDDGKQQPQGGRARERIEDNGDTNDGTARDPRQMTPEGRDPRQPSPQAGPMATSENVTTDEQRRAQDQMQEGELGGAMNPPIVPSSGDNAISRQAAEIESQRAAAENPLSPVSTPIPPPDIVTQVGLQAPPVPPNMQTPPQPASAPGQRPTEEQREQQRKQGRQRAKLEEEKVKVRLKQRVMLTDDRGRTHTYEAGEQEIPKEHAEHWYLRQHMHDDDQRDD